MSSVDRLTPLPPAGSDGAVRPGRPLLGAAALLALTLALVALRLAPPAARPATAPPTEFSAARAAIVLDRLLGAGRPHPIGSDENAGVRARVLEELRTLGLAPEVQTADACSRQTCGTVQNVLARIPGANTAAGRAVLLATHYDSVGAGPGASDAGVGVAALLETARALLASTPLDRPVILLVDDGEEAGLLGARAFVAQHPWAREVGAVVNLEARGTTGPSFLFETSRDNAWLIEAYAREARRPATSSVFYAVYERLPNDTDLTVFKAGGLSGINFAFIGGVSRYHTPRDDRAHVDLASLQHHGDNALAAVRGLSRARELQDQGPPTIERSTWFDVLGLGIVRWPEKGTWFAALAVVLCLAVATWRSRRGSAFDLRPDPAEVPTGKGLLWGCAAFLVSIGAGAAAAFLGVALEKALGALPVSWIAAGPALVLSTWALSAGAALLLAGPLACRAGAPSAWFAVWGTTALLALALATIEPAAAHVLLVPAFVALLSRVVSSLRRRGDRPSRLSVILPLLASALVAGPFAWLLHDAMGSSILWVVGGLLGLLVAGLLPLVAEEASRGRRGESGRVTRRLALSLILAAAIGLVWVARAAPVTTSHPERMTLRWHQDGATGAAALVVSPESGALPEALRRAGFGAERVLTLPWSRSADGFLARVDSGAGAGASLPVPEAETLEVTPQKAAAEDDGEVVTARLRLRSPRGAALMALGFAPPVRVLEARWGGASFETSGKARPQDGGHRFWAGLTVSPQGVEVEFRLSRPVGSPAAIPALLYDQTPGLPAAAESFLRARPPWGSASGWGDSTIVSRPIEITVGAGG